MRFLCVCLALVALVLFCSTAPACNPSVGVPPQQLMAAPAVGYGVQMAPAVGFASPVFVQQPVLFQSPVIGVPAFGVGGVNVNVGRGFGFFRRGVGVNVGVGAGFGTGFIGGRGVVRQRTVIR